MDINDNIRTIFNYYIDFYYFLIYNRKIIIFRRINNEIFGKKNWPNN